MGAWNETCGLTGLPIQYGDPVMLTFLTQTTQHTDDSAGTCYATGWWTPYALPIAAKYGDYGAVEEYADNWNTEWILDRLRDDMLTVSAGENIYHDYAVSPNELDSIETLMRWISNDRVFVRPLIHGETTRLRLGWMMCHKWAYEFMARETEDYASRKTPFEQVFKQGLEWYNKGLSLTQAWEKPEPSSPNLREFWRHMEGNQTTGAWGRVFGPGSGIDGWGSPTRIRSYTELCYRWLRLLQPTSHPDVQSFLHSMSQYLIVSSNMGRLRKHWSPQSGKGSQNQDFAYYQAWFAECQSRVTAKLAEQDEWCDADSLDDDDTTAEVA